MARVERFRFSHTRKIDSAFRHVSAASDAKVILNTARSPNGRYVTVGDERLLNFGSCSYMGLETMHELTEGAHWAIDTYGTQFSFSRAYLQCSLYEELETLLERITGRPVLVSASTSLAHMAALPVLIKDTDYILIDQFAHASLQTAVQLVPNVPLEILRHNRMDLVDAALTRLRAHNGNVWYICDGLYSMLGDFAPFEELRELLRRHERLRLYIDDAHSTSWSGTHGRGVALEQFGGDERVVVALSLNKAFSAAGGALAFPSRDLLARVRRCGGPMLFSGPIQPPMLGAAVGSARLHLSERFPALQAELDDRLALCIRELQRTALDLAMLDRAPIFHARCDSPRVAFAVADEMKERGFYCSVCVFPAVPMNSPGIRFTITRHNELADISRFVSALEGSFAHAVSTVGRRGDDERTEASHFPPASVVASDEPASASNG
jgi:7-keto-8-aminopelargonate synthetase-like enzyme